MTEHPNAQLARQAIEAMSSGDFTGVAGFLDDDVVWHYIGETEPLRGKAAMLAAIGSADYTIVVDTHEVLASDDHTIVLSRNHAVRGERTFDYNTAEILHIRDGKCVERWAFSDDTTRIVEFFA